mgnify:CR=1 FL=1
MDLPDGHVTTTTSPATTTTSPATTTTSPATTTTSPTFTPAPNAAPYTQTLPVGHNINNESSANGAQF